MRRLLALPLIGVFAMFAACGDDSGAGGEGGEGGGSTKPSTSSSSSSKSTSTSTVSSSSSSSQASTASSTSSSSSSNTSSSSGMGGDGGGGGSGNEADCNDGVDNDSDTDTDCEDADCAQSAVCGDIVINEVDYDNAGAEDFEFVEIYNAGAGPVDLSTVDLLVVNGNNTPAVVADTYALTGILPAGGYIVVADVGVTVDAGAMVINPNGFAVQNGFTDAVVLYDRVETAILDALTYEGEINDATIDVLTNVDLSAAEGGTPVGADNDSDASRSLIRFPNGQDLNDAPADWEVTLTMTPGAANVQNPPPEDCDNTIDDDGDGAVDCLDTDCAAAPNCSEVCDDGVDNDNDTLADCDDGDCAAQSCGPNGLVCISNACSCMGGSTEALCGDGLDNDCDGDSDCADSDCAGANECSEDCDNGVDDNGDTLADCFDPLCNNQICGPNGVTCTANMCVCPGGETSETTCNDTQDNDCDGAVDCADPDCAASCMAPALYFSEYVEGSSNDKALEIFNAGSTAVDLSACSLQRYSNGGTTPFNVALSGTIAAGDVFVLCNNNTGALPVAQCDVFNSAINHTGNDAWALVCNMTTLDVFGQIGDNPPGGEWGTGLTSTTDNTLRRLCSVTTGDTNGTDAFDPAVEWVGFDNNTFDGLGFRPCPLMP